MAIRGWRCATGRMFVAGSVLAIATMALVATTHAQPRSRRVCTPSAEVLCGELDVGPGIAAPRLAYNGADVGAIWTAGSPARRAIQFARIDERAHILETIVPIAHTSGDVAIAGATGGFLVAYRSEAGTSVLRVDRDGQVFGEAHRVADASDTLDLVQLDAVGGGASLTALVLASGVNVRLVYLDASGAVVDAPPRGRVLYGVGRLTRVYVVPFTSHPSSAVGTGRGYRTEAVTGDTVVATVSSTITAYTILRAGQPLGGSSNRTGHLDLSLGADGLDRLAMHTEDGGYRDTFTPAVGTAIEHTGVVGGRRPGGRGLAGEANLRDRSYLATGPDTGVEVGLLGALDSASKLVIARIHVRARAAPGPRAGRPRAPTATAPR